MQGHLRLQLNFPVSKSQDIPRYTSHRMDSVTLIDDNENMAFGQFFRNLAVHGTLKP